MTAQNTSDSFPKASISVTEMAGRVNLSRTHFWELCKQGVFPMPTYNIENKRPFFDLAGQQACVRVRATNIGHNGQSVIFYAPRHGKVPAQTEAPRINVRFVALAKILKRDLSIDVTPQQVETAVQHLFPQEIPAEDGPVIHALFAHFRSSQTT